MSVGDLDFDGDKKPEKKSFIPRAIVLCIFVSLTGLFHGYDNGVVSIVLTMPSFRQTIGWPVEDTSSCQ